MVDIAIVFMGLQTNIHITMMKMEVPQHGGTNGETKHTTRGAPVDDRVSEGSMMDYQWKRAILNHIKLDS